MRRAIRASVLVLLLTGSARAGYIQNGSPAPPPSPATVEEEQTTDGEMPNGLTGTVLSLLESLLALL